MAPRYDLDPGRKYSIAVVGGGIGGLCTAIGLLHHGVDCEIYEGTESQRMPSSQLNSPQPRAPSQR